MGQRSAVASRGARGAARRTRDAARCWSLGRAAVVGCQTDGGETEGAVVGVDWGAGHAVAWAAGTCQKTRHLRVAGPVAQQMVGCVWVAALGQATAQGVLEEDVGFASACVLALWHAPPLQPVLDDVH